MCGCPLHLGEDDTTYTAWVKSAIDAVHDGLRDEIARLDVAQPATLTLTPLAKKYPLHDPSQELKIRLQLTNSGGGAAFDPRVTVVGDGGLDTTLSYPTLSPGESRPVQIDARAGGVANASGVAELVAEVEWTNFDRSDSKTDAGFTLDAQDREIDWAGLQAPYTLDVAVGDRFVGRDSLLREMVQHVSTSNPGSFFLWGQKRVGKTSLVRAVGDALSRLTDDFIVVYLETIRELTAEETTNGMCRRLIARLRGTDTRFADVPEPAYTGSLLPLSDFIDQLLAIAPEKRFLIILDEFDELPSELYRARGVADAFFQTLGKGIAGKLGVAVGLVGGERIPNVVRAQGMRLNMYRAFKIDHFANDDEFEELVRQPGRPLEFSNQAIALLWEYSNGNPYYVNEICSRLSEMMIDRRDAHITPNEVQDALLRTIGTIAGNSFAHYWADGIEVTDEDVESRIADRVRFLVAAAKCVRLSGGLIQMSELVTRAGDLGCSAQSTDALMQNFISRGIVTERESGYRFRVRLFEEWLRDGGHVELSAHLWDDLDNRARMEEEREALISANELDDLIAGWGRYQGADVSPFAVRQWLSQFGDPQDQRLMLALLRGVRFYGEDRVRASFERLNRSVTAGFVTRITRENRSDILVGYLGPAGRSAQPMARLYRQVNKIARGNFVDPAGVFERINSDLEVRALVFADDFIGTGRSAIRHFEQFFEDARTVDLLAERDVTVWYVVAAGTSRGVHDLKRFLSDAPLNVSVLVGDELGPESMAFDESAPMWVDATERERAREIATSVGERLEGRAPLGYGGAQGLVVFEQNCPNTSLMILHRQRKILEEVFKPLFPRRP